MNNLLIAQSGGPTSAINATIAGAISCAFSSKKVDHVYGAINGIQGVFEEKFVDLKEKLESEKDFRMLCQTPSAALGSCRFKLGDLKKDKEYVIKVLNIDREKDKPRKDIYKWGMFFDYYDCRTRTNTRGWGKLPRITRMANYA